jgi:hypothetical protein
VIGRPKYRRLDLLEPGGLQRPALDVIGAEGVSVKHLWEQCQTAMG